MTLVHRWFARATLFYAAFAVLATWPLALHPLSLLGSTQAAGDSYLNLWILGWDLRTLSTQPAALFTGGIFNANIFFPAEQTLAYSDHLILQALFVLPIYLVTRHLALCYNILLVGSLVASALAMHWFAREVSGGSIGPYAAGLIWGFCPFHFSHLIHLQLQALYFLPVAFVYLHRLVAGSRRRDAVMLGGAMALQAVSSAYYGVIGALGLAIALAVLVFAVRRRRSGVLIRRLVLSGLVAATLTAPCVWPYYQVQQREGFVRNLYQAAQNSARPVSYLRVTPFNAVYGATGLLRAPPSSASLPEGHERELFIGFTAIALAMMGAVRARRLGHVAVARELGALILVGFILSLGPDGIRLVYSGLYDWVFGFQAIRAPARFAVLVFFGIAGLAALGVEAIRSWAPATRRTARPSDHAGHVRGRRDGGSSEASASLMIGKTAALAPISIALLAIELLNVPLPYVPAPVPTSSVDTWLAAAPEPGAVVYLPLGLDAENTPFMVRSLQHGRPIVNGYSGQRPALYPAVVEALADFPSTDSLWMLHDVNVRFVVVTSEVAARIQARPGWQGDGAPLSLRAQFADGSVYELGWNPAIEAALPRPESPPPPAPGPSPFRVGELAAYDVSWGGAPGGVALSAGTVRMAVRDPRSWTESADEGSIALPDTTRQNVRSEYLFDVSAETSDWVSRFFTASDRFESWSDRQLLPAFYEQHLHEGRRVLTRVLVFDHAHRVARLVGPDQDAASAPALPLVPWARDPLAAFFYVRTLPLVPGYQVRVPVNELGRGLFLDLRVAAVEAISQGGRSVSALRIEPRLVYRLERRTPVAATMWISNDERRVLLRAKVEAPFGSFIAELTSYSPGAGAPVLGR